MNTRIKICGLRRPEDIAYVNEALPDFAGFIVDFPRSPRNVGVSVLKDLTGLLDERVVPVGVFVDHDPGVIAGLLNEGVIRAAQLHGHEDGAFIERLRALAPEAYIIQAFRIKDAADVSAAMKSRADMILLDHGQGSGKSFDWSLLEADDENAARPYILAGGLGPENVGAAVGRLAPWGVDMSSGVETDGVKDRMKILAAVRAVRRSGRS